MISLKKSFCFCFNLKHGAMIMAQTNLLSGIALIIGGGVWMALNPMQDETRVYLICGIILGCLNLIAGGVLLLALVQGKERPVLLYILLEFCNLMVMTVFTGINFYMAWWVLLWFFACIPLWFGLFSMYAFYTELSEYNSVQSGVIEIVHCNTNNDINPMQFPEKAMDVTAV